MTLHRRPGFEDCLYVNKTLEKWHVLNFPVEFYDKKSVKKISLTYSTSVWEMIIFINLSHTLWHISESIFDVGRTRRQKLHFYKGKYWIWFITLLRCKYLVLYDTDISSYYHSFKLRILKRDLRCSSIYPSLIFTLNWQR